MSGPAISEAISNVVSNPLLVDMMIGVASNAAYDVLKRIIGCVHSHFEGNEEVFDRCEINNMKEELERKLDEALGVDHPAIDENNVERIRQFLFPNRSIVLNQLDENLCNYVADRIFYGVTLQSILPEIGYEKRYVKYLSTFSSGYPREPYFFDIRAKLLTPYIDTMLVAVTFDSRAQDPLEALQAIPFKIKQINQYNQRSSFRDFDQYVIIHTGKNDPTLNMRIRETLDFIQKDNPGFPRFVYMTKQDMEEFIELSSEECRIHLRHFFRDSKIDRGI